MDHTLFMYVTISHIKKVHVFKKGDPLFKRLQYCKRLLISECFLCMYSIYKRSICMKNTCAYKQAATVIKFRFRALLRRTRCIILVLFDLTRDSSFEARD